MAVAVVAGILVGGSAIASQAADSSGQRGTIRYAQLNSPGDGLDPSAAAEGNGRPSRRATPPRRKPAKRTR